MCVVLEVGCVTVDVCEVEQWNPILSIFFENLATSILCVCVWVGGGGGGGCVWNVHVTRCGASLYLHCGGVCGCGCGYY